MLECDALSTLEMCAHLASLHLAWRGAPLFPYPAAAQLTSSQHTCSFWTQRTLDIYSSLLWPNPLVWGSQPHSKEGLFQKNFARLLLPLVLLANCLHIDFYQH